MQYFYLPEIGVESIKAANIAPLENRRSGQSTCLGKYGRADKKLDKTIIPQNLENAEMDLRYPASIFALVKG